ncbi:Anthranilate synthase component 2 [Granulosicoccus antarcticus IMCC3135]|uniref:Anthranilate synthase component 2 n=1 Tax=Granulosicoccus antarcticus IMCC3135 TaxID=1192854 RepID=A0A2Z2NKJ1_9GAMM|nr:Anthranilate synthase component 2 [Granulosicoccus antarcticus IMCC3135]
MSILAVIDNYDSFTWNLVQYAGELGCEVQVFRNDKISCDELAALQPGAIMVSPGPGRPDSAGISLPLLDRFAGKLPILGVCLGHQSIGQHFGGAIVLAKQIMHGKLSQIYHDDTGVFKGLPNPFVATRYHSLVIDRKTLPDELIETAWTQGANGEREEIMGVRHRDYLLEGVQFHPESISSEHGHDLLANFLKRAGLLPRTQ